MSQLGSVSFQLSADEQTKVNAAIATLNEVLLPKTIGLSPSDRHSLPKMGEKMTSFVQKALAYSKNNPVFVPKFVDLGEFDTSVNAVVALSSVYQPISQLADALNDTMMLSGSQAMTAAHSYHSSVKDAARNKVPSAKTIAADLSSHFPSGPRKDIPTPPPTPATAEV